MAAGHFLGLGFNALEDNDSFVPRSRYPLPSPSPASLLSVPGLRNHPLHIHLGLDAHPSLPSLLPQPHPAPRAPLRFQPVAAVAVSFGSRPAGLHDFPSSPFIPPPPTAARLEPPPRASWGNPAHQLSSDRRYVHSPSFASAAAASGSDLRAGQDEPASSDEPRVSSTAPAAVPTHTRNSFGLTGRIRTPAPPLEPNSDDFYIQALVGGDFSSPSISPANPSPPSRPQSSSAQRGGVPSDSTRTNPGSGASYGPSGERLSRATGVEGLSNPASSGRLPLGLPSDFLSWLSPLAQPATEGRTALGDNMPSGRATRKRPGPSAAAGLDRSSGSPAAKRRRRSTSSQIKQEERSTKVLKQQAKRPVTSTKDFSDPFSEDEDNEGVINLTSDAPEPQPPAKKDNSIKLGDFQCVICMDDVTDLTVTYCGHLFCSECLHSALHIDANKKTCPVCRQKIDIRPAANKTGSKSKGYWPLELKLMTRRRAGKQVSR